MTSTPKSESTIDAYGPTIILDKSSSFKFLSMFNIIINQIFINLLYWIYTILDILTNYKTNNS